MTTTSLPAVTAPVSGMADDRGALVISDRTVERIAMQAVTEIDGVGGSVTRMLGVAVGGADLDQPAQVTAQVREDTVTLDVRLSVSYPLSVAKTTEAAREHLRRRTTELTGLAVSHVDITVTALHTGAAEPRRVL